MLNQNDKEKEVVIKLKAWQISYLLGSVRLGIWLQDRCAELVQSACDPYHLHSHNWNIVHILEQIEEQTKINDEETEYRCTEAMQQILEMCGKQCRKNIADYIEHEKEFEKR